MEQPQGRQCLRIGNVPQPVPGGAGRVQHGGWVVHPPGLTGSLLGSYSMGSQDNFLTALANDCGSDLVLSRTIPNFYPIPENGFLKNISQLDLLILLLRSW